MDFAGIWCGYVGVTRDHPLFRRKVDALRPGTGANYAGPNRLGLPGDSPWHFGFDCGGLSPACSHLTRAMARAMPGMGDLDEAFSHETYRDVAEARAECAALAAAVGMTGGR